ncbi:folate-binding protein [Thermithiobacillus plumbiphilus]|uniref:Folate-binding protein n=1 Tax=Thermithiobacillus plumbiphilus TaxID=1729899 RepID=A0ABU9DBK4_9PROT
MHTKWQTFLASQGASFDPDGLVQHFGEPQHELEAVLTGQEILCDLSQYGLIRVSGPDAEKFLQGQFSNDIRLVTPERGQLSSYSNPKGRMLANFFIFRWQDAYWLLLSADLSAGVVERLKKFRLMAKAEIEDLSSEYVRIGLAGPDAQSLLTKATARADLPTTDWASVDAGDMLIAQLPWAGVQARLVIGKPEATQEIWGKLVQAGARPSGELPWNLLQIRAGIGLVSRNTTEKFIPQELNLEVLGGINFKKGCYPGQEIVARTKYLGRQKSRTYRLLSPISSDPGTSIHGSTLEGQAIGQLVACAPNGKGKYECLAVLRIDNAGEDLRLASERGPELVVLDLPYPTEAA